MASTNNRRTLARIAAALAAATAAFAAVWTYRNRRIFTVNDITTGESFDYPELRAHVYFANPDQTIGAARRAIAELAHFRIVQDSPDRAMIVVEVDSAVGNFIDDMIVKAVAQGDRHARVVIRSRSRVGRGDLGENARHIRTLQTAMDQILIGG